MVLISNGLKAGKHISCAVFVSSNDLTEGKRFSLLWSFEDGHFVVVYNYCE